MHSEEKKIELFDMLKAQENSDDTAEAVENWIKAFVGVEDIYDVDEDDCEIVISALNEYVDNNPNTDIGFLALNTVKDLRDGNY